MTLAEKKCESCKGITSVLAAEDAEQLVAQLDEWQITGSKHLKKSFRFSNFRKAMNLAEKIAVIADEENHHPDLLVRWGELGVEIWTHEVNGLTENDFILAAKIDRLIRS